MSNLSCVPAEDLLSLIIKESGDYLPWLNKEGSGGKGKARAILPYKFVREAFDRCAGSVKVEAIARKLILDFCMCYLGVTPELPLPEGYEISSEVTELAQKVNGVPKWKNRNSYKKYEKLPKPNSSKANRDSKCIYGLRIYECCSEAANKYFGLKSPEHIANISEVGRYLLAEYALNNLLSPEEACKVRDNA